MLPSKQNLGTGHAAALEPDFGLEKQAQLIVLHRVPQLAQQREVITGRRPEGFVIHGEGALLAARVREDAAADIFLAWAPVKNLSFTAVWVDLGSIAGKPGQRGVYLSAWLGY